MMDLKERHAAERDPYTRSMLLFEMMLTSAERKQWLENERLFVQIKSPAGGYYVIDCLSANTQTMWVENPLSSATRDDLLRFMRGYRAYGHRYGGLAWSVLQGRYQRRLINGLGYTCINPPYGQDIESRWGDFLVSLVLFVKSHPHHFRAQDDQWRSLFPYPMTYYTNG